MNKVLIELTDQPIDLAKILEHVRDPQCGAEVFFTGTTRRWTHPQDPSIDGESLKETSHLIYEVYHPMAMAQLERLSQIAQDRWSIRSVAIVHRTGVVEATEASVVVAVSAPHRTEAFIAAKWLIDSIKHDVPIWKQEHYVQDGPVWHHPTSGSCDCIHPSSDSIVTNDP